jgi:hypothetical protein
MAPCARYCAGMSEENEEARMYRWWSGRQERAWLADASQWFCEIAKQLGLDGRQEELFLRRWFKEVDHYNQLWRSQRLLHYALAVSTIVVGLSIPFLVAVGAPDWG